MVSIAPLVVAVVLRLSPAAVDTPPPLPIALEKLSELRTMKDLVGVTILENGKRAPATLIPPQLINQRDVVDFMLKRYPPKLRASATVPQRAFAWMFIDDRGLVKEARMIQPSSYAELDSLALAAIKISRFSAAMIDGAKVGVWVPYPVSVASFAQLSAQLDAIESGSDGPTFTPYTVKPSLLNRNDVARALVKEYPANLRARHVSGTVLLWVMLDTAGVVKRVELKTSSGYAEMDEAAKRVAVEMRFTPALNRDKVVPVWIQLPIMFTTR
jgi:TonB family protein